MSFRTETDSLGPVQPAPEDVHPSPVLVQEGAEVAEARAGQLVAPVLRAVDQRRGLLRADAEDGGEFSQSDHALGHNAERNAYLFGYQRVDLPRLKNLVPSVLAQPRNEVVHGVESFGFKNPLPDRIGRPGRRSAKRGHLAQRSALLTLAAVASAAGRRWHRARRDYTGFFRATNQTCVARRGPIHGRGEATVRSI